MIEKFGDDIPENEIIYKRRKTTEKVEKRRKKTKKHKTTIEELIKLSKNDNKINNDNSDDEIILQRLKRALKPRTKKRDLIEPNAANENRK